MALRSLVNEQKCERLQGMQPARSVLKAYGVYLDITLTWNLVMHHTSRMTRSD